ncbi:DUF693 family protein (plasmid) [Borrelia anserina]|uniref:Uncharacterized protein n=2 Tax=Borrelia anserina TaxID=143 RepID=W5SP84_BORAN|nr:DUF693 family protein [Borrelia anserina]AHH08984.1 Hypothetical protein BAN_0022000 [Borrelia anserina BA2]APR65352.1 hypothetical protein N187_A33 [Borrelia anserina Es]UPA07317.1 DUF693 family protein [Borrelia anserina]
MLLFQYDFKIEFYGTDSDIRNHQPKLTIETRYGAPVVHIVISSENFLVSALQCKKAQLRLFNMPLNFNESLRRGDIVRIYYKKFTYEDDLAYEFIMSGYLGAPVDFDFENGDFICQYEIYLLSYDTFFNKKLDVKDYIGKSLHEAINLAFPDQAVINMSLQDRERIISESFYASTLKEFVEKLIGRYVHLIFVDVGDLRFKVDTRFVFINFDGLLGQKVYKRLEDFALLFVPQREVRFVGKSIINFWNASLFFTNKIKVGDCVQFVDRYGRSVKAVVQETGASLSNVGDCTLKLRLYDESNVL